MEKPTHRSFWWWSHSKLMAIIVFSVILLPIVYIEIYSLIKYIMSKKLTERDLNELRYREEFLKRQVKGLEEKINNLERNNTLLMNYLGLTISRRDDRYIEKKSLKSSRTNAYPHE